MYASFGDLPSTNQHHQVDANAFTNVPVLVAVLPVNKTDSRPDACAAPV